MSIVHLRCTTLLTGALAVLSPAAGQADESAAVATLRRVQPDVAIKRDDKAPARPAVCLVNAKLGRDEMAAVAEFEGLRELDLYGHTVTGAGLVSLAGPTKLERLVLTGTSAADEASAVKALMAKGANVTRDFKRAGEPVVEITIPSGKVTDDDLVHLKDLRELQKLDLFNNPITDAGLANVKGLTKLKSLGLARTRVSNEGMVHLEKLTELEELTIRGTKVGGDGLASLKGCTKLVYLNATGLPLGDEGLAHLKDLTALRELHLSETTAGDEGLAHLKGLTNLQRLTLAGNRITDKGLIQLEGLSKLRELDLLRNKLTSEGGKAIRNALPDCKVFGGS